MSTNYFVFKSLLTTPDNVLPLHLKETFSRPKFEFSLKVMGSNPGCPLFFSTLILSKPNLLTKDSNTVTLLHIRAYACACRLVTCSVLGSGAVHRGIPPTTSQSFTAPPAPPPAPGATPTAPLRPRRRDFAAQFAGQKM